MKFPLGQTVATPGALAALAAAGQSPVEFLGRHASGDWGEVDKWDWEDNDKALQDGSRIFSAYKLKGGGRLWIITEAEDDDGQRASTTLLLPEDY